MLTAPCVVGLIGHPVAHSRSPAMQQAAFDALGISARYALWDTPPEELPARVAALRGWDVLGANVTIPYKRDVLPLLDGVDEHARHIGAVNTIVREERRAGGRLVGHNTDVAGLREALRELDAWRGGHSILVLGAGGAARATLAVAGLEEASVRLVVRNAEAGRTVLEAYGRRWLRGEDGEAPVVSLADEEALAAALRATDLLINATPVGMDDLTATPLPLELLRQLPSGAFVFDIVYAPSETALVRAAWDMGLRASGGLPMLLHQGAAAFTLWTGQPAPLGAMRAALGLGA